MVGWDREEEEANDITANAEYPVKVQEKTEEGGKEEVKWVNGLRDVKGREWKDMHSRMGRKAYFGGLKSTS